MNSKELSLLILERAAKHTDFLVSPDDRQTKEAADKLVEEKFLRQVPSFSLADFWVYRITPEGRDLLKEL